jgi:hypothetical protein
MSDATYDLDLLAQSARKWAQAPGLRLVYQRLWQRLLPWRVVGTSLELGAGIGTSREIWPEVVTSDLVQTRYVERAVSCYAIEAQPERWANLLALDVLHHLRFPWQFFASAAAALQPGGRLILIEPAATAFGRGFYRLLHHEPMRLHEIQPPYEFAPNGVGEEFANMALGYGLFVRDRTATVARLATLGLQLRQVGFSDCLAYPLTGGYSRPQLAPTLVLRGLLGLDEALPQGIMQYLALRMWIVLEKA